MTIAMIGQKGLPARSGGIERHVEGLATGLVSRGHRVIVFARKWYVHGRVPQGVEQVVTPGIHTKHLDAITHSFTALFAARAYRPDIVHIHGIGVAVLAPLARVLLPYAKLVVTFHCVDRRFSKWGWFARTVFLLGEWMANLFAHELVTVSQELVQYCAKTYKRRATYIPHAFAEKQRSPISHERAAELVRAEGIEPGRYFLFVGRLLSHKGAHRLIQAYALLRQHLPVYAEMADLVIVGGSAFTDAYAQEVRRLAQQTPGVILLGERHGEVLRALQAQAMAHVFPSTEEGLSLAVLEGAYSGRPVLIHSLEANREATGGEALEVNATSIPALAGGLLGFLMMDESARLVQGAALRRFVERAFDAQMAVDRLDRVYRQALDQEDVLVTPYVAAY